MAAGKHPLWLEPRNGTPAPGEGVNATEKDADVVVGAVRSTGIVWPQLEGFIDQPMVEFTIRARLPNMAEDTHYAIRAALNDKRNWNMGGLQVNASHLFRDFQRLGSDADSFDYRVEYVFSLWDLNV